MQKYDRLRSVVFFRTDSGREPVREFLQALSRDERKTIGVDIKEVQIGWPLGMPLVRKMAPGLWEIRSSLAGRIARILFTVSEQQVVLLHGFIKKSQKTPVADMEVAIRRLRQLNGA